MKNYKRAPGRAENHPDWFWSLSGGIDIDCQTARDPAEVAAFEADARGAPVEESVSILYEDAPQQGVVA